MRGVNTYHLLKNFLSLSKLQESFNAGERISKCNVDLEVFLGDPAEHIIGPQGETVGFIPGSETRLTTPVISLTTPVISLTLTLTWYHQVRILATALIEPVTEFSRLNIMRKQSIAVTSKVSILRTKEDSVVSPKSANARRALSVSLVGPRNNEIFQG